MVEVTFALGSPITTNRATAAWSAQDNTTTRPLVELSAEALTMASNADLIIYVGGLTPAQEGEGFDRSSIELPEVQEKLVEALQATGKPMARLSSGRVSTPFSPVLRCAIPAALSRPRSPLFARPPLGAPPLETRRTHGSCTLGLSSMTIAFSADCSP